MVKSFFVSLIILLVLVLLEAAVLSNIFFIPVIPDLILLAVAYFAVHNGRLLGTLTGFCSGLMLDFLSACPLGLNCLLRTIVGYLLGLMNKRLNTDSIFLQIVLGIVSTLIKAGILWLIATLYPSVVIGYKFLSSRFIAEVIVNGVLSPVLFKVFGKFDQVLVLTPEAVS